MTPYNLSLASLSRIDAHEYLSAKKPDRHAVTVLRLVLLANTLRRHKSFTRYA